MLFNKDSEFREWLSEHGDRPVAAASDKSTEQEAPQAKSKVRTMFADVPQQAASK
jgi:hypothetical protein